MAASSASSSRLVARKRCTASSSRCAASCWRLASSAALSAAALAASLASLSSLPTAPPLPFFFSSPSFMPAAEARAAAIASMIFSPAAWYLPSPPTSIARFHAALVSSAALIAPCAARSASLAAFAYSASLIRKLLFATHEPALLAAAITALIADTPPAAEATIAPMTAPRPRIVSAASADRRMMASSTGVK